LSDGIVFALNMGEWSGTFLGAFKFFNNMNGKSKEKKRSADAEVENQEVY
jgi:hypothetical protein